MILLLFLLLAAGYAHVLSQISKQKAIIDQYSGDSPMRRTLISYAIAGILCTLLALSAKQFSWIPHPYSLIPIIPIAGIVLAWMTFKAKETYESAGTSKARPAEEACFSLILCHVCLVALSGALWVFQMIIIGSRGT